MGARYLKQAIVVRTDLDMNAGKSGAMIAHVAMTYILQQLVWKQAEPIEEPEVFKATGFFLPEQYRWMTEPDVVAGETADYNPIDHLAGSPKFKGQLSIAKVVLQVAGLDELCQVEQKAREAGLIVHSVVDSGHSHNDAGTHVACAIGPYWPEQLDPITKKLSLYRSWGDIGRQELHKTLPGLLQSLVEEAVQLIPHGVALEGEEVDQIREHMMQRAKEKATDWAAAYFKLTLK
jgi:peptidyl-tRNA hydrolase